MRDSEPAALNAEKWAAVGDKLRHGRYQGERWLSYLHNNTVSVLKLLQYGHIYEDIL